MHGTASQRKLGNIISPVSDIMNALLNVTSVAVGDRAKADKPAINAPVPRASSKSNGPILSHHNEIDSKAKGHRQSQHCAQHSLHIEFNIAA